MGRIPGVDARRQDSMSAGSDPFGQWSQTGGIKAPPAHRETYANRVEVKRREHDATITFYRDSKSAGTVAAVVIVPLALLADFTKES